MQEIEVETLSISGDILIRIPASVVSDISSTYHNHYGGLLVDPIDGKAFAQLVARRMSIRIDGMPSHIEHALGHAGHEVLLDDPSLGIVFPPDDPEPTQPEPPFDYDAAITTLAVAPVVVAVAEDLDVAA